MSGKSKMEPSSLFVDLGLIPQVGNDLSQASLSSNTPGPSIGDEILGIKRDFLTPHFHTHGPRLIATGSLRIPPHLDVNLDEGCFLAEKRKQFEEQEVSLPNRPRNPTASIVHFASVVRISRVVPFHFG